MIAFIDVGFGAVANLQNVVAILAYDSNPVKRMVRTATLTDKCVDATRGNKTSAVLVFSSGNLVLSALTAETLRKRLHTGKGVLFGKESMLEEETGGKNNE